MAISTDVKDADDVFNENRRFFRDDFEKKRLNICLICALINKRWLEMLIHSAIRILFPVRHAKLIHILCNFVYLPFVTRKCGWFFSEKTRQWFREEIAWNPVEFVLTWKVLNFSWHKTDGLARINLSSRANVSLHKVCVNMFLNAWNSITYGAREVEGCSLTSLSALILHFVKHHSVPRASSRLFC